MSAPMQRFVRLVLALGIFAGCSAPEPAEDHAKPPPPARVETARPDESALATITLTAEAEERLGLETAKVVRGSSLQLYEVGGEIQLPPGQTSTVTAPVAGSVVARAATPVPGQLLQGGLQLLGIVPLLPVQRDLRVNAEAELTAAQTRLEAAQARAERARRLLQDRVGSVRAVEDAEEAVQLAETAVSAARSRLRKIDEAPVQSDVEVPIRVPHSGVLRQIFFTAGQMISSGAPLFEVARMNPVWVRVPVYSGDLLDLEPRAKAHVRLLGSQAGDPALTGTPVQAPPSADPAAATSDLFFQLPNPDLRLQPGEKVTVSLPTRKRKECLQVPWSAVVYDVNGGQWVYQQLEPHRFARTKVLVESVHADLCCLVYGPEAGAVVVTAGVAELFGAEFGIDK